MVHLVVVVSDWGKGNEMDFIYSKHWENLYFFLNGLGHVLHPVSREIEKEQTRLFSLPKSHFNFLFEVSDTDI